MLYLTKTPHLVVEVNNREAMEVEKLVKETAVNVIQKFYEFKSTKKPQHEVSIISCYHCQGRGISIIDVLYVNMYRNAKIHK